MKIRVWGCRGSFICPEPDFTHYGGNTTCLEITSKSNNTLLVDAGSGLIRFGRDALKRGVPQSPVFHLLLTHTHIDHLQGFSFFTPIHFPNTKVKIYCASSDVQRVEETFRRLFHKNYSPIQKIENLQANIQFIELEEGSSYHINGFSVSPILLDHPSPTFGYRIEEDGKKFGLVTDHEIRDPLLNERVERFFASCDLVFHDGQYTERQYKDVTGWGHSAVERAIASGHKMDAGRFGIFHHSPDHNDDTLQGLEQELVPQNPEIQLFWVKEDMEIQL